MHDRALGDPQFGELWPGPPGVPRRTRSGGLKSQLRVSRSPEEQLYRSTLRPPAGCDDPIIPLEGRIQPSTRLGGLLSEYLRVGLAA
jgi:hypothetical protein